LCVSTCNSNFATGSICAIIKNKKIRRNQVSFSSGKIVNSVFEHTRASRLRHAFVRLPSLAATLCSSGEAPLIKSLLRKACTAFAVFVFSALAAPAWAGQVTGASIIKVVAVAYDAYFVFVDLPIVNSAACAKPPSGSGEAERRFIVSNSTAPGKAQISTILTALALNKKVDIVGLGSVNSPSPCNVQATDETVFSISVYN
jgi:hypothetical protein